MELLLAVFLSQKSRAAGLPARPKECATASPDELF